MKYNNAYYFYHNDHLGTPQKLVAQNGSVVWSATYSAFGEASVERETVTNNLRFPGQYYDVETGLHYNWHRYYDPGIGRYVSVDPISFAGGDANLYRYVKNNPLNFMDPEGRFLERFNLLSHLYRKMFGENWMSDAIDDETLAVEDMAKGLYDAVGKQWKNTILWWKDPTELKNHPAAYELRNMYVTGVALMERYEVEGMSGLGEQMFPNLHHLITTDDYSQRDSRRAVASIIAETVVIIALHKCLSESEPSKQIRIHHVDTGGLRNELPLTAAQKTNAIKYAKSLGVSEEMIIISENMNTGYALMYGKEILYIGTDVLPSTNPDMLRLLANSRISMKGTLAHEIIGHRAAALAGMSQEIKAFEEAQASIRAARFAPGLSSTERTTLIRDALKRLHDKEYTIKDVKNKLWIDEP